MISNKINLRYLRHQEDGFICWPGLFGMTHIMVAQKLRWSIHNILSAGYIYFTLDENKKQIAVCYGGSISLDVWSREDDSFEFNKLWHQQQTERN